MNSGYLLRLPTNLKTSIGGKRPDSMSFCKILLILSSVWLSPETTVSLPSTVKPPNSDHPNSGHTMNSGQNI